MVCLGATGRNFAAGMSGGIAYVYDPTAEFPARCNMGMVALQSVEDSAEAARLKGHLEEHVKYTDSAVAKRLLADWSNSVNHFVKVMCTLHTYLYCYYGARSTSSCICAAADY
jgi:glutamate synthase (NADPH) large chain